ncbi:tropinone reductase homolog At2g29260, chloroplastic-like [Capsicum annuum]|uniref:tropinone reductase homolog At2g29260, chloroplastic-like n=1 Tax=Capsicum annuum TaxID=4072 RepID=UPI001FB09B1B|nr:tropinone reductase homolog At2g29260, chloroplastic-like [Capsicum annuum]
MEADGSLGGLFKAILSLLLEALEVEPSLWKAKGFKVGGSECDLLSRSQQEKFMDTVSSYFDGKINILKSSINIFSTKKNGAMSTFARICAGLPLLLYLSGAMNQLTRSLACEWAKDNIRVNAVAAWVIKTSQ